MKALNVTEFYSERGGGVRSHLTLKRHFSCQLGHEHIVVAPGPRDFVEDHVVRIAGPPLPYDPTYHLLWRVDKIHSLIARERPDVLEMDSPYMAAMSCLTAPRSSFGIRTLVWHSDFIDTYLRVALKKAVGRSGHTADFLLEPFWAGVRALASGCDATFVAGRWMKDKLVGHGVPRVIHLPFGVDKNMFTPAKRSDELRRRWLHGRPGSVLIGVGRFAVEKRWDVVLDAFTEVRRASPCVLVLFGDGPERSAMEARARELGRDVLFMGFEKDRGEVARALASADLLVHGGPHETFCFAVAEALSAGVPVVVPRAGGAAELAPPACAELYAPEDAADCARAIRSMLARVASQRDSLADGAARAAATIPSVQQQFERTYAAYAELLAARRPAWRVHAARPILKS